MGKDRVTIDPEAFANALVIGRRAGDELHGSARRVSDCCEGIGRHGHWAAVIRGLADLVTGRVLDLEHVKRSAFAAREKLPPTLAWLPFRSANRWMYEHVDKFMRRVADDQSIDKAAFLAFPLFPMAPIAVAQLHVMGEFWKSGLWQAPMVPAIPLVDYFRRFRGTDPLAAAMTRLERVGKDVHFIMSGLDRAAFGQVEDLWYRSLRAAGFVQPPATFRGNGNLAVGIAGMGSRYINPDNPPIDLPFDQLGYAAGDVRYISYRPGSTRYSGMDTFQDLDTSARAMDEQMRALKREQPDRHVDVYAHSLGGAVTMLWLKRYYRPDDPAYPTVDNVFTFSSPLQGVPLAAGDTSVDHVPETEFGVRRIVNSQVGGNIPPDHRGFTKDVQPGSETIRFINEAPMPKGVKARAYGATDDYVVPGSRAHLDGQSVRIENPKGLNDHTDILNDPATIRDVQSDLMDQCRPYRGLLTELRRSVEPSLISIGEDVVTNGAFVAGTG